MILPCLSSDITVNRRTEKFAKGESTMNIIELDDDNLEYFEEYIGADIAENIKRPFYKGLIAEDDHGVKGGMIWNYKKAAKDCVSVIEWFNASDSYIAEELFLYYRAMIKDMYVRRSEIVVPATRNKAEKEILKHAGFTVRLTESDDIIVTLSELSAMPLMKDRKIPRGVTTLGEVTMRHYKEGISRCTAAGKKGLCEDIGYLPVSFFAPDVSACYINKADEIMGFLLFHLLPSGMFSIQLMVCLDKDVGVVLPGMMRKFVSAMEETYPPDTKILLNRHNEASLLLTEKLLPRGFGIPVYAGSREE